MAKLLLDIIKPLEQVLVPALYAELRDFTDTTALVQKADKIEADALAEVQDIRNRAAALGGGIRTQQIQDILAAAKSQTDMLRSASTDPAIQANKIREKLAEELFKSEMYTETDLDAIYEAGQQITHEYPLNKSDKDFICPITLETITLGDDPTQRNYVDPDDTSSPLYTFTMSGRVFKTKDLQGWLALNPDDPVSRAKYSEHELKRIKVTPTTNRARIDEALDEVPSAYIVFGCTGKAVVAWMMIGIFVGPALYDALLEMEGVSDANRDIATEVTVWFTCLSIAIISAVALKQVNLARWAVTSEQREANVDNARKAALVGAGVLLTPMVVTAYLLLGQATGRVFGNLLDLDSGADAGMAVAAWYAAALVAVAAQAYWHLRHRYAHETVTAPSELALQRNLKLASYGLSAPVVLAVVGALGGLIMDFTYGGKSGHGAEYGMMGGMLLGFLLACVKVGIAAAPCMANAPLLWTAARPNNMTQPLLQHNNINNTGMDQH